MTVRPTRSNPAGGFSLPEVLMAIFILGIGVISIAALFPAGIAQQRQAVDDTMGPIVAQNALTVLRSRVDQNDFGTFEDFDANPPNFSQPGDWPWLRPAFIFPNGSYPLGAIDIFNGTGQSGASENATGRSVLQSGLPFNEQRYGEGMANRPLITISQEERYYPQAWLDPSAPLADQRPPKPQYAWDCMFRRFQGRVFVAVIVYRVTVAGAPVAFTQIPNGSEPPLPRLRNLATPSNAAGAWDAWGADGIAGTRDDAIVAGSPCASYDPTDPSQSWQEQGQWLLDQNNNVHRVLSTYCDDGVRQVELVRPVPGLPAVGANYVLAPFDGVTNIVTDIWYVPRFVNASGAQYRLTPVYLTVRGL